jgi:hypothetical protein
MSKPVVLLDAGELVALSGTNNGDALLWNSSTQSWESAPGGGAGTVTSVALSTGSTGLTVSGGTSQTITGSGTFALAGTLGAGFGGTGLGAPIAGDAGKVLSATAFGGYELTQPTTGTVTSVTAGAGLVGGTITTTGTISLPNFAVEGTFGTASTVPVITVDGFGRVTQVVPAGIQIAESQVSGLVDDLAGKVPTSRLINTASGQLTGGGALSSDLTLGLASVGTARTDYGSGSYTVTLSTDAYGRVTALAQQPIAIAGSAITSGTVSLARGGTGHDFSTITAGQVIVGKTGGGDVQLVSVSGDATLAASGQMTVTGLQGVSVSGTAPTAGQVLTAIGAGSAAWATPSGGGGGGGGGGLTYYLNYNTSAVSPPAGTWKLLSLSPDGTGPYNTGAVTVPQSSDPTPYVNLADFVTAVGEPGATTIAPGLWDINVWLSATGAANDTQFRFVVGKWDGTTQTDLYTSGWTPVTDPANASPVQYTASVLVSAPIILTATERITVKVQGQRTTSSSKTMTAYFCDGYPSHMHTTIGAPGGTGLVKVVNGIVQAPATLLSAADISGAAGGLDGAGKLFIGKTSGASPAVATLTGTTGQVIVTNGDGTITLSLPQSIATTSSPTFAGLTLSGLTNGLVSVIGGVLSSGGSISGADFAAQSANVVFAGPSTGSSATPTFRTLVTADIPSLDASKITSGVFGVARGGTGLSSYAIGDLVYADTTTSLARLADVASGNALLSGGVGIAPSWGKIGLTTHVSGVLPIANGGTNNGSLSVTSGSVYYGDGSKLVALAPGTSGQFLQSQGSAAPQWAAAGAGSVTSVDGSGGTTGLTLTGGPITSSGTLTLGGTLLMGNGGTGRNSSLASGSILYGPASGTAMSALAIGSTGQVLTVSGGAPVWSAAPVTTAASPLQVSGGSVQFTSQTANTVLAAPNGSNGSPSFRALVAADLPSLSSTYLPLAGGTLTGKLNTVASATGGAGLSLPPGAAPTTPVSGDVYTTTSGLFAYLGTTTYQFAPLASPGFTGTPTGPTASAGTNTTQLATTAFVAAAVTAGGYVLPVATASVLGGVKQGTGVAIDVAGVLSANVTSVAGRTGAVTLAVADVSGAAPLASPTFTGDPKAPTPTTGDNDTSIATTAFVTTAVSNAKGVPYDVSGEVGGTPPISTEVFHFKSVRGWTLASSGHAGGVVTAPSATTTFDIYKNTTSTVIGTISIATSGVMTISISASGATLSFAAGDMLFVKTQANVFSVFAPYWTFVGTVT